MENLASNSVNSIATLNIQIPHKSQEPNCQNDQAINCTVSNDNAVNDNSYHWEHEDFLITQGNLYQRLSSKKDSNGNKKDVFELICRNIKFIGLGSADNGDKHGFIVEFISITGRREQMFIHSDEAHNFSSKALLAATKRGIDLNGRKGAKLIDAIACFRNDKFYEYISNNGWNTKLDTYCSNGTVFSSRRTDEFFIEPELVKPKSNKDITSWNKNVGIYVKNNPILILNTALALSSVLLKYLETKNVFIQYTGQTSSGKTSGLEYACSIMGNKVTSFKASKNGLEALAQTSNDSLVSLDEIAEANPEIANQVYSICNGLGTNRMNGDIKYVQSVDLSINIIGTGEISIYEKLSQDGNGAKYQAGLEVRAINIPVGDGYDYVGIIQNPLDGLDKQEHVKALLVEAKEHSGVLGDAFLEQLVKADRSELVSLFEDYQHSFKTISNGDRQIRVSEKFALLATALSFAIKNEILDFDKNECDTTLIGLFNHWQNYLDRPKGEDNLIINNIARIVHEKFQTIPVKNPDLQKHLDNCELNSHGIIKFINDNECFCINNQLEDYIINSIKTNDKFFNRDMFRKLLEKYDLLEKGDRNGMRNNKPLFKKTISIGDYSLLPIKSSIFDYMK